jgi:hypothetical protein
LICSAAVVGSRCEAFGGQLQMPVVDRSDLYQQQASANELASWLTAASNWLHTAPGQRTSPTPSPSAFKTLCLDGQHQVVWWLRNTQGRTLVGAVCDVLWMLLLPVVSKGNVKRAAAASCMELWRPAIVQLSRWFSLRGVCCAQSVSNTWLFQGSTCHEAGSCCLGQQQHCLTSGP